MRDHGRRDRAGPLQVLQLFAPFPSHRARRVARVRGVNAERQRLAEVSRISEKRRDRVHRALRRYRTSRLPEIADAFRRIPQRTAVAGAATVLAVWLLAGLATGFHLESAHVLAIGLLLGAPIAAALAALQYMHLHNALESWLEDNPHVLADLWPALEALRADTALSYALGHAPGTQGPRILHAASAEVGVFVRVLLRTLAGLDRRLERAGSTDALARQLTGITKVF